jgi:hypothetical protein
MSPWRRPLAQGSQDRALTTLAARATGNGSFQLSCDTSQFTHPLLDVGEVAADQLIDAGGPSPIFIRI